MNKTICDLSNSKAASYNPFDEENSNTRRIKALMLVQKDLVKETLTDSQKALVNYVICENHSQIEAARYFGISQASVSKTIKAALCKLRKSIHFCDLALRYYENDT